MPELLETSVCIIGAGVVGITLARELKDKNISCILFDRGHEPTTDEPMDIWGLNDELIKSYPSYLRESRMRGPGGSSGHWANCCKELEPIDLVNEQFGGWPISYNELKMYYAHAYGICKVDSINNPIEVGILERDNVYSFKPNAPLFTQILRSRSSAINFHTEYGDGLDIRANHAFTGFTMENPQTVNHANFSHGVKVKAKKYIMAMGGVDNAKHLLMQQNYIGDLCTSRALGKFFHEHFHIIGAKFALPQSIGEHVRHFYNLYISKQRNGVICLHPDAIDANDLLNSHIDIDQIGFDKDFEAMGAKDSWFCGRLRIIMEHETNALNNVELLDSVDQYGIKKAKVNLRVTEKEWRTVSYLVHAFKDHSAYSGMVFKTKFEGVPDLKTYVSNISQYGSHHIGTTRMSTKDEWSVVDPNCKIKGSNDIYCAGSSVFPTGGHAAPTLTIVAMTLRLADHLIKEGV